jgi:hypothetical protein
MSGTGALPAPYPSLVTDGYLVKYDQELAILLAAGDLTPDTGSITAITSDDGSVTITDPDGPSVDLSVNFPTQNVTLAGLPSGTCFYIQWNTGAADWYYNGASCGGVRPSNRGDLVMIAQGGTAPPVFMLTTDNWQPSVFTSEQAMKPAAWLYETYSRAHPGNNTGVVLPTAGALNLSAIFLPAGLVIGHLHFVTDPANAAGAPQHWWMGLYDNNLNQLATTADQTNGSLAATSTDFSEAIAETAAGAATEFTTTYSGLYYIGLMVASANTLPGILATINEANFLSPVLMGKSDLAQTTPPAFPHAATALPTGGTTQWYFGVS